MEGLRPHIKRPALHVIELIPLVIAPWRGTRVRDEKHTPNSSNHIENGPIGSTPESGSDALSLAIHNRSRMESRATQQLREMRCMRVRTPEKYSYILPLRRPKWIPLHTVHCVGAEWAFRKPHPPSRIFIVLTGSPRGYFSLDEITERRSGTMVDRLISMVGSQPWPSPDPPLLVHHRGLRVKPREEGRSRIKRKPTKGYKRPFH